MTTTLLHYLLDNIHRLVGYSLYGIAEFNVPLDTV